MKTRFKTLFFMTGLLWLQSEAFCQETIHPVALPDLSAAWEMALKSNPNVQIYKLFITIITNMR